MNSEPIRLLLADDDKDDCLFFEEVLEELSLTTRLTTVHDGEQLMRLLEMSADPLPHVLFLDLNIPRKNGLECLSKIRSNPRLQRLSVIIFSTSSEQDLVNLLYLNGAHHYIRKPAEFSQLKKVIHQALTIVQENMPVLNGKQEEEWEGPYEQPVKERFVLSGDF